MHMQLKVHVNKLIAISLLTALLVSQFISVHTHLAEEQHHHGIHTHNIESHYHGWLSHYSSEPFSHGQNDNQFVDIKPTGNLTKFQHIHKNSIDIDAAVPQQSIYLSSLETSRVINPTIVAGIVNNYPIPSLPRAPPISS
ncbi:MAG: hypothetical protein AB7C96_01885 [Hydrogenovibrio sp.]